MGEQKKFDPASFNFKPARPSAQLAAARHKSGPAHLKPSQ